MAVLAAVRAGGYTDVSRTRASMVEFGTNRELASEWKDG